MDRDKIPVIRRPEVLRKLNAENLLMIERGLLGDLPEKLKPQPFIPRARPTNLEIAKPSGFLSSCLPAVPDSPGSGNLTPSSDEDKVSPLKKSFSFRDKFSRISFFGKDRMKDKIVEEDAKIAVKSTTDLKRESKAEYDYKNQKRYWFFRNKELSERPKSHRPIYQRSKSFEFLPRAIKEEEEPKNKKHLRNSQAFGFESDSMGDAWTSNESLEYISNVYYDNEDGVFLKSVKEFPSESSGATSSISTVTSASQSSTNAENIFKRGSVQDLLDEFNKAVDMFSETYLSDCEPYTKSNDILVKEKRKSSSFTSLPSAKVMQVNKVSEISEEFKLELSEAISAKRAHGVPKPRRGSVTDWFVLEDQAGGEVKRSANDMNKYRRGQKKPMNRVRRISSTKYWITPEECAVFTREQRPPLVIPRITQYRAARMRPPPHSPYPEDTPTSSMRLYDRLGNWSPSSERSRADIDRSFSKASSDSPPFGKMNKRLGGSTEDLLGGARRPPHLQLPASSSGDSLDVEIREHRAVGHARSRKSKSMMSPKQRIRSPIPAPRNVPAVEPSVILEGTVKRTKFFENNKKCKKNWLEFYMTLTPTKLVFYKDYKTYLASKGVKPSGTPPSPTSAWPESVLPLLDARALPCMPMHTRRHSRSFVLSVKYDQYLIQCETEEGARLWQRTIEGIICKLLTSKVSDSPVSHYQSSTTDLESLGRTPPARHRTKPKGSSNEDLSDSTETSAQKTHVKTRLKKFFARRPAMEVLVKKGIYKDEPVFGRNLEEVCPTTSPRVPEFLVACVKEIESSLENMCTDGLYRASGNLSQVQKVRLEIDQNHLNVIQNNSDVHVLTGSLKLFLRELKEPLIPCNMFDRILAACSLKPREAKIKEFRDIINSLPQCNRDTLKYLLEHLLRVTSYSEQNRMHTANLAIVFGPTILWAPAEKAHNIAVDCIQQNNVVDILLNEFKDIFAEDAKGKKKA